MTERIRIPGTQNIETSPFYDTGHVSQLSREQRLSIPNIDNQKVAIGLSDAALRNIHLFAEHAYRLHSGQNIQADMNELSSFRNAYFTSLPGEAVRFMPFGWYVDETIVQTNIDPYIGVIETLGMTEAPSYPSLLESGDWREVGGYDFLSPEYVLTKNGLKAMLYMRGDLPESEMDSTPEYSLGVAVYYTS